MATEEEIIARESGGNPYVGYTPPGKPLVDLRNAPLDRWGFPIWSGNIDPTTGLRSHAAGKYQFQPGTWREGAQALGVTDFSPASQKKVYDWTRAKYGETPWAASAGGGGGRRQTGPLEGAYDPSVGATRLTVYAKPEDRLAPFLLDHLLNKYDETPEAGGHALLDNFLTDAPGSPRGRAMGGASTVPAPDGGQAAFAAAGLPSNPAETTNRFPMQTGAATPSAPMQTAGMTVPPYSPQGMEDPSIVGLAPRSQDYPSDDEYGHIPKQGPALTPITPLPDQRQAGGGLLDHLLGISSAQAGELPRQGQNAPAPIPPQPIRLPQPAPQGTAALPQQSAPTPPRFGTKGAILSDIGGALAETGGQLLDKLLLQPLAAGARGISGESAPGTPQAIEDALAGAGLAMTGSIGVGGLGAGPRIPAGTASRAGEAIKNLWRTASERDYRAFQKSENEAARGDIREQTGLSRQRKAQASASVEALRKTIAPLIPEYDAWIKAVHAGQEPPTPAIQRLNNYMQGVGQLQKGDGALVPIAKALRENYERVRNDIEAEVEDWTGLDDYVRQMWVETRNRPVPLPPEMIRRTGKQGSGASLKERRIPTIEEGIRNGLTPVFLDPIENMLHYTSGMEDFLAWNRAHRIGIKNGHISTTPQEGLVPLDGRLGGYAAPGYAKIWNNYIGKGWRQWPAIGNVYDKALHAVNTVTAAKLGLSGYHAWNIVQETAVAGIANAIGKLSHGDLAGALKEAGFSAAVIPKVSEQLKKGKRLQEVYLGMVDQPTNMERALSDLYAHGGGRATGRGAEYSATSSPTFWRAFRRGALRMEARAGLQRIAGKEGEGPLLKGVLAGPRAAMEFAHEVGRLMQSVSEPLFDAVIPKIKFAAWADEMEEWLRSHPDATGDEQLAQSRRLIDTMDDRFGEMIQDNLFWNPLVKQTLNLLATSVGWEYGSLRAFGGAAKDIAKGQLLSPRARWLYSFPVIMALSGAAYQYFKTGKGPQDAQDLAFPQTGGATPEGKPELALLPGYEKDALQWYHELFKHGDLTKPDPFGVARIAAGKLNPAMKTIGELATNQNWLGQPLTTDQPFTPPWFKAYAKHVLEAYEPIPTQQEILKGSNIGRGERFGGVRPAPAYIEDPQRADDQETRSTLGKLKGQLRGLYAHGNRVEQDPRALEAQAAELRRQIEQTQRDYQARKLVRSKQPSKVPLLQNRTAAPQPSPFAIQ